MKVRDFISGILIAGIAAFMFWAIGRYKSKHQYHAIQVRAKDFRMLLDTTITKSFKTLYIHQGLIPSWPFSSDRIGISPITINMDDDPIPITPFFWKLQGTKFPKDKKFATYELSKDRLRQLVTLPRVRFFIFQPSLYEDDNDYIKYDITAYDSSGSFIKVNRPGELFLLNPTPPSRPYQP